MFMDPCPYDPRCWSSDVIASFLRSDRGLKPEPVMTDESFRALITPPPIGSEFNLHPWPQHTQDFSPKRLEIGPGARGSGGLPMDRTIQRILPSSNRDSNVDADLNRSSFVPPLEDFSG